MVLCQYLIINETADKRQRLLKIELRVNGTCGHLQFFSACSQDMFWKCLRRLYVVLNIQIVYHYSVQAISMEYDLLIYMYIKHNPRPKCANRDNNHIRDIDWYWTIFACVQGFIQCMWMWMETSFSILRPQLTFLSTFRHHSATIFLYICMLQQTTRFAAGFYPASSGLSSSNRILQTPHGDQRTSRYMSHLLYLIFN